MRRGGIARRRSRGERSILAGRYLFISRTPRSRFKLRTARGVNAWRPRGFHARTSLCSYGGRVTLHRAMRWYARQRLPAWTHVSAREHRRRCACSSFFFFSTPDDAPEALRLEEHARNFYPERNAVVETGSWKRSEAKRQILFSVCSPSLWWPRLKYNDDKSFIVIY